MATEDITSGKRSSDANSRMTAVENTDTGDAQIRRGTIKTYHPGFCSCDVLCDKDEWTCFLSDKTAPFNGFSMTMPPCEGDIVYFIVIGPKIGAIICRQPVEWIITGADKDVQGVNAEKLERQAMECSGTCDGTARDRIGAYMIAGENPNDMSTMVFNSFRPTDVYSGEFSLLNEFNNGIKAGLFSSTLIGGGAQLRLSSIHNSARLSAWTIQSISCAAWDKEYHNGRHVSYERDVALYQEERLGAQGPDTPSTGSDCITDHAASCSSVWAPDAKAPAAGARQTGRNRLKELQGWFGHLESKFACRPEPGEVRSIGSGSKEQGVMREIIDPSGQVDFAASGMISIERTGRIPIPSRICMPWDVNHDLRNTPLEKLSLAPFEHDKEHPNRRPLELFDRIAYDKRNLYARVDGLGLVPPDESDYNVPNESELKPLEDAYDPKYTNSRTVNLKENDGRRAGMYIGEDGSVIIRDAWGSEIIMQGGNIKFHCAGNIQIMPGLTLLTVAGDDIVQKARNSVDIHASEHDVRLSAARNMEIVGGADDENYQGGVIIEARGERSGPWDGTAADGEDVHTSGITLKAKKSDIVAAGKNMNLRSEFNTSIISGRDGSIDGTIDISSKIHCRYAETITDVTDGACMLLSEDSWLVAARNAMMAGDEGAAVVQGTDLQVPFTTAPMGSNVAADTMSRQEENIRRLSTEEMAASPYDTKSLDKMFFGFRTAMQCRTDKRPWDIGGPQNKIQNEICQPAWVQVKDLYKTLSNVKTEEYIEKAKWESYPPDNKGGEPWPGKDSEVKYVALEGVKPANLIEGGFNIDRASGEMVSEDKFTESDFKKAYIVRKQDD